MSDLKDKLREWEEAAGKANCLPMKVNRYDHGGGRFWTNVDGTRNLIADFYEEGDRELFALMTPERIKALAEVAMAAQVIASQRNGPYLMDDIDAVMAAEGELKRALERLGKAVGT